MAIGEAILQNNNSVHAYMDTDSILVSPKHSDKLVNYFRPLNPYTFGGDFLENENPNKWFYGISSKRYCVYTKRKDSIYIQEDDHKLHGLGHIYNPFSDDIKDWQKEIWNDILKLHYGYESIKSTMEKYGKFFIISKQTISKPSILKRFVTLNSHSRKLKQILPFNFILVGEGTQSNTKQVIKPICAFKGNTQSVPYEKFIDYHSCQELQGEQYWNTLDNLFFKYINHPESKFIDDGTNLLKRRHVVNPKQISIGKEVNNLDTQILNKKEPIEYKNKTNSEEIAKMSVLQRRQFGITRQQAYYHRKKLRA